VIPSLGYGLLVICAVVSAYGAAAAAYGAKRHAPTWAESARAAMLATFPLLSLSVTCLLVLLLRGDNQVQYVFSVTSSSMPTYLRIASLWGGQSGSLLFWSWLLSAFAAVLSMRSREEDRDLLPWVTVVLLLTLAFFLSLVIFVDNPFARFWLAADGREVLAVLPPAGAIALVPPDGRGLNPLLRHPGMVLHPPALYLGFVAFIIPYAYAIAALITGRTDDLWMRLTRRWTLMAWLFLSIGLLLGSRWAYDVLGWGGYWGWDPVEIAALMPWLTGTAFLHSVMIQERRGLFKRWNITLVVLTYSLVIFGTFLTRSGILSSVHAFSQSAIGPLFFAFIGMSFTASLALLLRRWNELHDEGQMTSLLSRESLFLLNNLLFMGVLAVCFWGVIFPLISELLSGQAVTVGPPYYKKAAGPLFAALVLLMGVAPLSAWGASTWRTIGKALWKPLAVSLALLPVIYLAGARSWAALLGFWVASLAALLTLYEYGRSALARRRVSGENLALAFWRLAGRNRRRYGGYIIHLGVVLIALGVIGIEFFQSETQGTLERGQGLSLGGYGITFDSLAIFDTADGRNIARAVVRVERDGKFLGELYPRSDFYYDAQQPMTIPGLRSTLEDDLYVLLVDWQPISTQKATFKVYRNPLVSWLWFGGLVFILGTVVAVYPGREPNRTKKTHPAHGREHGRGA